MYESLMHDWFDQVWNKGNADAVHRLLAPDALIHNLAQDGQDAVGPDAFLAFFERFRDAFPDIHVDVHQTVVQGDIIAGRWTVRATHTGHGLGFPATDRPVSFEGMSLARVGNGQIIEAWNVWDAAAMRDQLGLSGMSAAAG